MPLYTPGRRRAIVLLLLTSVLLLTLDLRGNAVFDTARSRVRQAPRPVRDRRRRRHQAGPQRLARDHRLRRPGRGERAAARPARRPARRPGRRPGGDPGLPGAAGAQQPARRSATTRASRRWSSGRARATSTRSSRSTRARNDDIEVGMAVIAPAGLVGKVTAPVLPDRADVMLLTDSRYAVGVKVVPGAPPRRRPRRRRPRRPATPRPYRRPPTRRRRRRASRRARRSPETTAPSDDRPAGHDHDVVDHDDHDRRHQQPRHRPAPRPGRATTCRRSTSSPTPRCSAASSRATSC